MQIRILLIGGVVGALAGSGEASGAKTKASWPDERQIAALIMVESKGDDWAVGDKNLKHKAYGCLQLRQPYVDDINRTLGTKYRAKQCLGNRKLSIFLFREYMKMYASRRVLGREPTREDIARIHNGGPKGWKRSSTRKYWAKVQRSLNR